MTALAAPLASPLEAPSRTRLRLVRAPEELRPVVADPGWSSARPVSQSGLRARRAAAYRRRRAVVALVGLVVVVLAWQLATSHAGGAPALAPGAPPAAVHVVRPGDTLWSIARQHQPEGDVRPLVDRLARHHGSARLDVGDRVVVPA